MEATGSVAAFLTPERLVSIMPTLSADRCSLFLPHLVQAMDAHGVTSPARATAFLAQAAHESGELAHLVENLNYSAQALRRVWPGRFPTDELAARFDRHPEQIANHVYGGRLGNGPEASGDGWRYRGRGIFQLTGRSNYSAAAAALNLNLVDNPDQAAEPAGACATAAWFWLTRGLNALADAGRFTDITRSINGGTLGLQQRISYWQRACRTLGVAVA